MKLQQRLSSLRCRLLGHRWQPIGLRRFNRSSSILYRCDRCRQLQEEPSPRYLVPQAHRMAYNDIPDMLDKALRRGTADPGRYAREAIRAGSMQPLVPVSVSGRGVGASSSSNVDHNGSPCDWSTGAPVHIGSSTSTPTHSSGLGPYPKVF